MVSSGLASFNYYLPLIAWEAGLIPHSQMRALQIREGGMEVRKK
jgi:hypothetical protein